MNKIHVQMTKDGSHTLMSSLFDDSYHAHNGAMVHHGIRAPKIGRAHV